MITIDKCRKDKAPSKMDFKILISLFKHKLKFENTNIFCYEFKKNKWIHYHGIIKSSTYLKYTDFVRKGWSFKIQYLKTTEDLLGAVRYINKQKIF